MKSLDSLPPVLPIRYSADSHAHFVALQHAVFYLATLAEAVGAGASGSSIDLPGNIAHYFFRVDDLVGVVDAHQDNWPDILLAIRAAPQSFAPEVVRAPVGEITLDDQFIVSYESSIRVTAPRLDRMVKDCLGRLLLEFLEGNLELIRKHHGRDAKCWPDHFRIAWIIRNAVAHDGLIALADQSFPTAKWRGLSMGVSDNGGSWFGFGEHSLGAGDVLLLLDELSESIRASELVTSKAACTLPNQRR